MIISTTIEPLKNVPEDLQFQSQKAVKHFLTFHTAPYVYTALTQLRKFTQPRGYPPCGVDGSHSHHSIIYIFAIAVILCNEYESFAVHLQLQLFLVSARPRVFRSGCSVATLVFTAPPSRSSKVAVSFDLLFRDLTEIFSITPRSLHQHGG